MDAVSYAHSAKQAQRIEKFIENPDSASGIVTVPKTIASGETITIPAGRVAVLPNLVIDGVLNIENDGEVFIPSGSTFGGVVEKVTSTDNAIVRFDGVTGAVQNSGVIIDDNNNVGIGTSSPAFNLDVRNTLATGTASDSAILQLKSGNRNSTILLDTTGGSYAGNINNYVNGVNVSILKFDSSGNILSILPNGALGYGSGSGGTVTQLTSKSTAVTLNKPTGRVVTNNAPLASGASIQFKLNNSLINITDTVYVCMVETGPSLSAYDFRTMVSNGYCYIYIANQSGITLSDAIGLNFTVIKGATA